jgi:hypothetical protein
MMGKWAKKGFEMHFGLVKTYKKFDKKSRIAPKFGNFHPNLSNLANFGPSPEKSAQNGPFSVPIHRRRM